MDASLHSFLRRLEREGVIRLDLRAIVAIAAIHTERAADDRQPGWPIEERVAAITSILAHDAHTWTAVSARLAAYYAAPVAYLAREGPPPPPASDVLVTVTGPSRPWTRLSAWLAARAAALERTLLGLPRSVWAAAMLLMSVVTATALVLGVWTLTVGRPRDPLVIIPFDDPAPRDLASLSQRRLADSVQTPAPPSMQTTPVDAAGGVPIPPDESAARSDAPSEVLAPPIEENAARPDSTIEAPQPTGDAPADPGDAWQVVAGALGALAWLFAAVGIRWLHARDQQIAERGEEQRRLLLRRAAQAEDDAAHTQLYAVEHEPPLALAEIDDAATALGRLTEVGRAEDLDIAATLDASVRAGGRFTPVRQQAHRQRHLTVLVDVETGSHPYFHAVRAVLARWQQLGVKMERHDFKHRPRFVEACPVDADNDGLGGAPGPRLALGALARRDEGSPLLILTRMADLAERTGTMPWLRQLEAWPVRVLLDLDPRSLDERDGEARRVVERLRESGVRRFPFTAAGIRGVAAHLSQGTGQRTPEPVLPAWQKLLPALRQWAVVAACVSDPTWAQLDAFRRHYPELRRALPGPHYVQRLLDWLRSERTDPISADGRRLALSRSRVVHLLEQSRGAEGLPAGALSSTERRARALILQQIAGVTPTSEAMHERLAMRTAFHRAVLDPRRADDLLPYFASLWAPELRELLHVHLDRIPNPSVGPWRAVVERLSDQADGPIPLRCLVSPPWPAQREWRFLLVAAATPAITWSTMMAPLPLPEDARVVLTASAAIGGLVLTIVLHRQDQAARARPAADAPPTAPPPEAAASEASLVAGATSFALHAVAPMMLVELPGGEFAMGSGAAVHPWPRRLLTGLNVLAGLLLVTSIGFPLKAYDGKCLAGLLCRPWEGTTVVIYGSMLVPMLLGFLAGRRALSKVAAWSFLLFTGAALGLLAVAIADSSSEAAGMAFVLGAAIVVAVAGAVAVASLRTDAPLERVRGRSAARVLASLAVLAAAGAGWLPFQTGPNGLGSTRNNEGLAVLLGLTAASSLMAVYVAHLGSARAKDRLFAFGGATVALTLFVLLYRCASTVNEPGAVCAFIAGVLCTATAWSLRFGAPPDAAPQTGLDPRLIHGLVVAAFLLSVGAYYLPTNLGCHTYVYGRHSGFIVPVIVTSALGLPLWGARLAGVNGLLLFVSALLSLLVIATTSPSGDGAGLSAGLLAALLALPAGFSRFVQSLKAVHDRPPAQDPGPVDRPGHTVWLAPFSIGVDLVTVRQWYAVMDGTFPPDAADDPVHGLSWFDAIRFLNRLSDREDLLPCYEIEQGNVRWMPDRDGYRLPTEAEWEYAARAGSRGDYSFGDDPERLGEHAWFAANCDGPQPVGQKPANAWGLHDVHGNVAEWVWDQSGPYGPDRTVQPRGPGGVGPFFEGPHASPRILRGGAFFDRPEALRSAARRAQAPTRARGAGLRVARGRQPR